MNKIIEVKGLTKIYGKRSSSFKALKGLDLDIFEGESVAIVGKSGSGKSTLMHLLALLDRPTSGTITIDGVESTKLRARSLNRLRNQSFGFVFQQFFMNPHDTVLENVMLPLKIAGVKRKVRRARALKALKTVGLEDRVKFKANDLSGGQKQRVCVARAIVNDPKIIFADEPTGNLDSATGEKVIKLLFDANQKRKATLIIVTHDEDLAALCDRQIRIMDGSLVDEKAKTKKRTKVATEKVKTSEKAKATTKAKATKAAGSAKTAKATKTASKTKSATSTKTAAKASAKTPAKTTKVKTATTKSKTKSTKKGTEL